MMKPCCYARGGETERLGEQNSVGPEAQRRQFNHWTTQLSAGRDMDIQAFQGMDNLR
jgi:hypothetical protein